jgi:hypothetical protein
MCQIVHIPARFMAAQKPYSDPREQAVSPADSTARSLIYQDTERQRYLDSLDSDEAKQRALNMFDDSDASHHWKNVVALADNIAQHLYTCPSRCLPTHKRERLLVQVDRLVNELNESPYAR